jgi:hypothetical protein
MVPLYILILAVPMFRQFFGLNLLPWEDYLGIAVIVVIWTLVVRWAWKSQVFGRFFGYDLEPEPLPAAAAAIAPQGR